MPSPLITRSGRAALMAPQYMGSAAYYACMARYARAAVDLGMRYDKRFKSAHRCCIADTRGLLRLTVPVEKVTAPTGWNGVGVSSHGQWWSDHIVSLESAYGRTPFFEFYFDRFRPLIADRRVSVSELDREVDQVIRGILGLETEVEYLGRETAESGGCCRGVDGSYDDFRGNLFPGIEAAPYYQVRQDRLGFIPGLSVLDLIFNMGPEAPLVLKRMQRG